MLKKIIVSFVIAVIAVLILAVVIPIFIRARSTTAAPSRCADNLMIIEECKDNWAHDNGKKPNDAPTWDDLKSELHSYAVQYGWTNDVPVCPDGGTYTIGRVGEKPTCSIGGPKHSLP